MIHELPSIMMATISEPEGTFVQLIVTPDQQMEILKIKLNEAIHHINNLEEKLLSPEDLIGLGAVGTGPPGKAIGGG